MDRTVPLSRLRVERLSRQISTKAAAEEAQINQRDYGRVEALRMTPSRRVSALLSAKYGVPADVLFAPFRP